ncbi:MAG: hypothetical protein HZB91_04715 [Elusimicrobia bacterium]|nr:hypothetical protein [Elusimicrobiota bacterium]
MDKSLDDLRQALRKLRQDIESQAGLPERGGPSGLDPAPAVIHPREDVKPRPQPKKLNLSPVDEPEPRHTVLASAPAAQASAVPGYLKGKSVLPCRSEEDDSAMVPSRASAPAEPKSGGASVLPKVLLALGFGMAAGGAVVSNGPAMAGGLILCLVGVLFSGASSEAASSVNNEELRDLGLRIAALERRISTGSRAAESGAISREVVEEIVELRRILTSLFRALEKPPETE